MSTKKLLVAFDPKNPSKQSGDFLIPWEFEGTQRLCSLKSGKSFELGIMVYIGLAITENELFAKLVDAGTVIPSVDNTLTSLRSYLAALQAFKIGNVVRLEQTSKSTKPDEVVLELVANTPSGLKF